MLLIAIDELRADHISHTGYDRETTPNLDRLATSGASFARTYSAAPLLIPSHTTLMTGCYSRVARRRIPDRVQIPESNRWYLPDRVPRLAVEFLTAGYATAAFLDTEALLPFSGYEAGFQVFDRDDSQNRRTPKDRGGAALSGKLRGWLTDLPADRNWFAYLHFRDLDRIWRETNPEWDDYFSPRNESPYIPPVGGTDKVFFSIPNSRWDGLPKTLDDYECRYDGALRRIDKILGTLFRNLELEGNWSNTTVCVVGSYGVQFGEAGLILRGGMLSVPDLHVPWILRLAPTMGPSNVSPEAALNQGTVYEHLASLVDIAPTLLDWEGIEIPSGTHGVSHVPALIDGTKEIRSHAFASDGMVNGAVVFGSEWALEELQFSAESPELLRQWFGTPEPDQDLTQRVFYRHGSVPYAALAEGNRSAAQGPPTELAQSLTAVLTEWQFNILGTWALLQTSFVTDTDEDREFTERLIELGYLGAER